MMKKVMSFWILAAAWGQAALPALADPIADFDLKVASGESAATRLEARSLSLVAPRVVAGTQNLVSSNGLTTTAWDTTALANGWHEVEEPDSAGELKASLLVANLPTIAVEGGRLSSSATWTSNAVHWVRNRVVVPDGVTLTVREGAIVKFGEGTGITVEKGGTLNMTGKSNARIILTSFADDVYGGDSDFGATNAVYGTWSVTTNVGGVVSDAYTTCATVHSRVRRPSLCPLQSRRSARTGRPAFRFRSPARGMAASRSTGGLSMVRQNMERTSR